MKAWLLAAAISMLPLSASFAVEKSTKEQAMSMVKQAVAMIKTEGKQKTFEAISDPGNATFHNRDLYVYVYDFKGVTLAHGNNPKMVGRSYINLKDTQGRPIIREMIKIAQASGSGWLEYNWPNPVTKTVEPKDNYVERVDDFVIGCGAYR